MPTRWGTNKAVTVPKKAEEEDVIQVHPDQQVDTEEQQQTLLDKEPVNDINEGRLGHTLGKIPTKRQAVPKSPGNSECPVGSRRQPQ